MFRACVSVSKSVSYWNLKIAVAGTGYVEVVGACLAENGNEVVCVDKEASWFRMMRAIEERNQAHKARLLERMTAHFGRLNGGTIASSG